MTWKNITNKLLNSQVKAVKLSSWGCAGVDVSLGIAHALHGKVKRLVYRSPVTGDVEIFNHDPF